MHNFGPRWIFLLAIFYSHIFSSNSEPPIVTKAPINIDRSALALRSARRLLASWNTFFSCNICLLPSFCFYFILFYFSFLCLFTAPCRSSWSDWSALRLAVFLFFSYFFFYVTRTLLLGGFSFLGLRIEFDSLHFLCWLLWFFVRFAGKYLCGFYDI